MIGENVYNDEDKMDTCKLQGRVRRGIWPFEMMAKEIGADGVTFPGTCGRHEVFVHMLTW